MEKQQLKEQRDGFDTRFETPNGSADAEELFAELYDQLHRHAAELMRQERNDHTLQPTALLHEAYLRLVRSKTPFKDQNHFVATASIVLRRVLVNSVRAKRAQKRGGNQIRLSIQDVADEFQEACVDILELDTALRELATLDATQHRLVELRFFGGMTNLQAAQTLGISERAAYSEWAHARAWLRCQLGGD